jgi:hypothetical protein
VKIFKNRKSAQRLNDREIDRFYNSGLSGEYEPTINLTFIHGDRYIKGERTQRYTVTYWKPARTVKEQKLYEHLVYLKTATEARKMFDDASVKGGVKTVIKSIKPTGKSIGKEKQYKITYTIKRKP